MSVTLYSVFSSHPGLSAHLALEYKQVDHRVVNLAPGLHAPALRALGFAGSTVPALLNDGHRLQGSRTIMRALEDRWPDPPLFPADPELRSRVEEAERWGEELLQPFPRQLFAWISIHGAGGQTARRTAVQQAGLPAAGLLAAVGYPLAWFLAQRVSATRADEVGPIVATLPTLLDHVEGLLADGTIGGATPNAADFQIATTVRLLLEFGDLRPHLDDRPAARYARGMIPDYPFSISTGLIPARWLEALG